MNQARHQSERVTERDRWLLRSRRLRRAVALLATALVLGFGGLAAAASATHHTNTASSSGSTSSGGSPAPKSTSQSPTVTSGGS